MRVGKGCVGSVDGIRSNAASEIFNDDGFEAETRSGESAEADAVVVGDTGEEQSRQAALAQVSGEACGRDAIVFRERGVAVDVLAEAFAEEEFGVRDLERGMEICAGSALDAMVGPEVLRAVGSLHGVGKRLFAVRAGEGDMAARVPILGKDDVIELFGEGVDAGDDGIAIADLQSSANAVERRKEVALHVVDEESVGGAEVEGTVWLHRFKFTSLEEK